MLNKRGDLSITTIIVIILALLVLIVAILIFSGVSNTFLENLKQQLGFGTNLVEGTK